MTRVRTLLAVSLAGMVFLFIDIQAQEAQRSEVAFGSIDWVFGPARTDISDLAQMEVPEGYMFTGEEGTKDLMELMQNPVNGSELGFMAPKNMDWFVVFEYAPIGYVKDDEHEDLDVDAILESIKEGTREANRVRETRGWAPIDVLGWSVRPNYNPVTHNLEWAILGEGDGHQVINHSTRLLGRRGVMSASLVLSPEVFATVFPRYSEVLGGYSYHADDAYEAYRPGDKISEYGLTALITGGAVAVAAQTGLLKKLWKLIIVGVLALFGALKRLLGGPQYTAPER